MSDEFDVEIESEEIPYKAEFSLQETETLIEESKKLLSNLYNVDDHQIKRIVSQDELRNDVSSFVSSQLHNLENQNRLKMLYEAEMAKLLLAHELSVDEIYRGYSLISSEKSKNVDSLFKLFAPTQTTPNTILTPATKDEEKETVELTSSQRQAMEKLSRIVQGVNSESKVSK